MIRTDHPIQAKRPDIAFMIIKEKKLEGFTVSVNQKVKVKVKVKMKEGEGWTNILNLPKSRKIVED